MLTPSINGLVATVADLQAQLVAAQSSQHVAATTIAIRTAKLASPINVPSAPNLSLATLGVTLTVVAAGSGRLWVNGSFLANANGASTDGLVGALRIRDTTGSVVYAPGTTSDKAYGVAPAFGQPMAGLVIEVAEGLVPGTTYNVDLVFGCAGTTDPAAASLSRAVLAVWPL